MGLVHAFVGHLLLFFLHGECFYYVERSVSLRILVEILASGGTGIRLEQLRGQYAAGDMIRQRLEVLLERGFIRNEGRVWTLTPKGRRLGQLALLVARVFRSKPQHERV